MCSFTGYPVLMVVWHVPGSDNTIVRGCDAANQYGRETLPFWLLEKWWYKMREARVRDWVYDIQKQTTEFAFSIGKQIIECCKCRRPNWGEPVRCSCSAPNFPQYSQLWDFEGWQGKVVRERRSALASRKACPLKSEVSNTSLLSDLYLTFVFP